MIRSLLHLQAAVADDDAHVRLRLRDEGEVARVRGDPRDCGIDLVEGEVLVGPTVGCDRPRAEADDADARDPVVVGVEDLAERALAAVVAERFAAMPAGEVLDAVDRRAVHEHVLGARLLHAQHAEERAIGSQ